MDVPCNKGGAGSTLPLLFALLLLAAGASALTAIRWDADQVIEDNGTTAYDPRVAIDGTTAVAAWRQVFGGKNRVYSNRSTDGGATWGTDQLIDTATENADNIQLALSGQTAIAIWRQQAGAVMNLYANRSGDGGATWSGVALLETSALSVFDPHLILADTLAIAFWRLADGVNVFRIWANRSLDGGVTWEGPRIIDDDDGNYAYEPRASISETRVVAVWYQTDGDTDRIYAKVSTDAGATWTAEQRIENVGNNGGNGYDPDVAVSETRVVAVWSQSNGDSDRVYSNRSLDGGATWLGVRLIDTDADFASNMRVVMVESDVLATWIQWPGATGRVFGSRSVDGGDTWAPAVFVDSGSGASAMSPELVHSGRRAIVVWYQAVGGLNRVFANQTLDLGGNWGEAEMIEDNVKAAGKPHVAVSGVSAVAVWAQPAPVTSRIHANRARGPFAAPTTLPIGRIEIPFETGVTINAPIATTETFVQVQFSGGGLTTGSLFSAANGAGTGANYVESTTLTSSWDTAVISLWTNQTSLALFAGLRSDTGTLDSRALPIGIETSARGLDALGRTALLIEFADSTDRLLGDSTITTAVGDSVAYTIRYLLSETTAALYHAMGFDTASGSTSFRLWYADTYGGTWVHDSSSTVAVTAAPAPWAIAVTVSGITRDLPGALGGVPPSSGASSGSGSACFLEAARVPGWLLVSLRSLRDGQLLSSAWGRLVAALYYLVSGAI